MADTLPEEPPVVCAGVVVADHVSTPIDHLPAAGELVMADELLLSVGGCASNAAVDLAKLGVRSTVCGRVGDDALGRFVSETLASHRIDVRSLKVDPACPTSQTLIVNVRGQDRRFIHSFGANRGLSAEDLDLAIARPPRVLYVGGFLILPGLDPGALAERFAGLRRRGTITVLDVATPGPADYLGLLAPVLKETDVFLPNTDEAALILNETNPVRQAEAFREMGARRVVITLGDEGSVAVSDSLRVRLGAFEVPYVDGSGGGDAFDAGYIAGLLDGRDEVGCLTLASAIGASCVRAVGTTAGVFTRDEVETFLERNRLEVTPL
jgi:sugar/nucleoside kinase (ribokinase family)